MRRFRPLFFVPSSDAAMVLLSVVRRVYLLSPCQSKRPMKVRTEREQMFRPLHSCCERDAGSTSDAAGERKGPPVLLRRGINALGSHRSMSSDLVYGLLNNPPGEDIIPKKSNSPRLRAHNLTPKLYETTPCPSGEKSSYKECTFDDATAV